MAGNYVRSETEVEWGAKSHRVFNETEDPIRKDGHTASGHTPIDKRQHVVAGALWTEPSFSVWLAGSGVVGTAPPDGPLLIAAGVDENIDAGVSVTYDCDGAISTNTTAVSLDFYYGDGLKVPCGSSVLDLVETWRPGEPIERAWAGAGTYTEPTEASGSATIEVKAHPIAAKGLVVTLATETLVIKEMMVRLNNANNSPHYDIVGTNGVANPLNKDQDPLIEILAVVPAYSVANYFSDFTSETKLAFSAVAGTVAGNICTLTADLYMRDYSLVDVDGLKCIRIIGEHSWLSGDTQIQWAYT